MVSSADTYLRASDGTALFVRCRLPDGVVMPACLQAPADSDASRGARVAPASAGTSVPRGEACQVRGVIQIVHGMAEHSARYDACARAAAARGYVVVADDHRGHGRTVVSDDERGHTADTQGWTRVLDDLSTVRAAIEKAWPQVPVVALGHSWGSMLVRGWVAREGEDARLAGLIVMGTMASPGLLGFLGWGAACVEASVCGPRHPSAFLEKRTFTTRPTTQPPRTDYDWLSRDPAEVDRYIADPWCGQRCTAAFYRDLTYGAMEINRRRAFAAVPTDLPVLVISGGEDPIGGMGQGVRKVARSFGQAGVRDVTLRLYPQARHELLHEINQEEVIADVLGWIDRHVPAATIC